MRTLLLLALCGMCLAQPQFEVASIKPNNSMDTSVSINWRPGGTFSATNVPLRMLITFAYDVRDHQLTGGPGWMDSDRYDIEARPGHEEGEAEPKGGYNEASASRMRERVRALLADRFHLTVHTETKEMPIYALVVAKNGAHLSPATGEHTQIQGRNGSLSCKKVSMQTFAEKSLAQRLRRNVVDRTGLAGEFDFEIKYAEDRGAAATADVSGPDFLTAMQEQIGLKLEPTKGPVPVIVIDHAEKASAN